MTDTSFKTFLTLFLSGLLLQVVNAAESSTQQNVEEKQERWFQIEVIVFQHTNLKDLQAEHWPKKPQPRDYGEVVDFLSPLPANPGNTSELTPQLLSPETEIQVEELPFFSFELKQSELPFLPLQKQFVQMSEQLNLIKRSRNYRLLRHSVWRQPIENQAEATAVRIIGGNDFGEDFFADGTKIQKASILNDVDVETQNDGSRLTLTDPENLTTNTNVEAILLNADDYFDEKTPDDELNRLQNQILATGLEKFTAQLPHVWELDGTIKIHLRRYLHITLDLEIKQLQQKFITTTQFGDFTGSSEGLTAMEEETGFGINWGDTSNSEAPENNFIIANENQAEGIKVDYLQPYPLLQKRRVRSKEVHYFDHPILGVIVYITPYDNHPEPEKEDENNSEIGF